MSVIKNMPILEDLIKITSSEILIVFYVSLGQKCVKFHIANIYGCQKLELHVIICQYSFIDSSKIMKI
jgi:hypothetical protein